MARGIIAGLIAGSASVVVVAGGLSLALGPPESPRGDAALMQAEEGAETRPAGDARDGPGQVTILPDDPPPLDDAPREARDDDATAATDAEDPAGQGGETTGRRPPPETTVERVEPPNSRPAPPGPRDPGATAETRTPRMPSVDTTPSALPEISPSSGVEGEGLPSSDDAGPEMPRAQAEVPGLSATGPDIAPAQPPAPPVPAGDTPLTTPETNEAGENEADRAEPADAPPPPDEDERPSEDADTQRDADRQADSRDPEAVPADDAPESERPTIGQPATTLTESASGGGSTRLPRVGDDTGESNGDATAGDAPARAGTADPPLIANAADVEADNDLPRLAVVLIDDGDGPLGPEALRAFPFPVSFAIDPSHPNPSAAARAYRDLGFEVLAIARVPDGASAQDVEVTLSAALDAVPGAVAVIEPPEGGLQASTDIAAQAASFLARSGHGLVSMPQGLNTGQQIAAREGVPSITLFRDFDSEGQDARVIRRFLDQGAFRARQEGAVVMLGRLRADTISALVLWGLQDRAQSVALVPISVVLREADQDG